MSRIRRAGTGFALLLCLAGGLRAQAAAEVRSAAPATVRVATLAENCFPRRVSLLRELRRAVRTGADRQTTGAIVRALTDGCHTSQAFVRTWAEARGGRVLRHYWVIPGVAVELPASAVQDLDRLPAVTAVYGADRVRRGQIRTSTNAQNHNTDHVHAALGEFGAGVNLALIDSGVDVDVNQTGQPHPAFDCRPPKTGTRIVQAIGVASSTDIEDLHGHGSAVAGIALAADWNGLFGLSDDGHAPDAGLVSYKVTSGSSLGISEPDVIAAWQDVLADAVTYNLRVAVHSFDGDPDPTSPAQQALDAAAYYGDILVVTSAGNDGQSLFPGQTSQSNANGLTVGAIVADSGQAGAHQVTAFSTPGPLPGDGSRYFPDLVACGDSVVSVKIDAPTGVTFNQGTSFAAAQVAGVALLVRGAAPTYSALDAKALILNNVQDIAAENPGKSRFHYGLGMMRADLAVAACTAGTMLGGRLWAAEAKEQAVFTVAVEAQKPYSATLVWPRTDPAAPEWDDLDLSVIDPAGKVIAISNSPRNLYERVLFVPTVTGSYVLMVQGVDLTTSEELPFSIAFGENLGGGVQAGSYELFGGSGTCLGTAGDPAAGVIVPAAAAGAALGSRTRVPFSYYTTRLQQAYPGSDIPAGLDIHRIAFRRDEQQSDTPGYDAQVELLLGYTKRSPGDLDPTFQNNIDGAMTEVVALRTVRFPGTQGLPAHAGQFDFVIPLDAPFVASTTASRHLLMEVRVYSHTMGNAPFDLLFDAWDDPSIGRVYTRGQPSATAGIVDNVAIAASLMSPGLPPIAPNLQAAGRPQLGQTFAVVLRHAPSQAPAVLVHGGSSTSWGPLTLPIDLTPFGAPGCQILTDSLINLPAATGSDGSAEILYVIPQNTTLMGEIFYNQGIILDPGANPFGLTLTGAGRALIGG